MIAKLFEAGNRSKSVTVLSDTHGLHDELKLDQEKVLIHAGNITEYGIEGEVLDF